MNKMIIPNRMWTLLFSLLFVVLFGCSSQENGPVERDTKLKVQETFAPSLGFDESVRQFLSHYVETLESKDPEEVRQLYVDDGRFRWFTDGALSYSSANDVLTALERNKNMKFNTLVKDVHVEGLTDLLASTSSNFRTTLEIPGSDNFTFHGVITMTLERESSILPWRILLGHTSTPGGPPKSMDS